jgi:hypothetical protein
VNCCLRWNNYWSKHVARNSFSEHLHSCGLQRFLNFIVVVWLVMLDILKLTCLLGCYSLAYLLAPCSTLLLEKLDASHLVNKFLAFDRTRRFITALTSARHLSLSWASSIQSVLPHPTSWSSILILPSHLRLGYTSGLFTSGFPHQILFTPLLSPIRATCPAHLILLNFITRTVLGEQYRSFNPLTPNDPYKGRTATLTSKRCILYIYSTYISTEFFKHGIYSPFFLFKMQFVS